MDNNISNLPDCRDIIYSDDYIDYVIDLRREVDYEFTLFAPCEQNVSDNFVVEYSDKALFNTLFSQLGYRALPNCYGLMDTQVLEETGVLRLRRQPYINLYGRGVIFGMVDCGIDYTNEAFIKEDGSTRIVAAWNQEDKTGPAPEGLRYGTEYTSEQINEALRGNEDFRYIDGIIDGNGHGTAMASVAAGRILEEEEFSGIAPYTDIAVVKLKQAKQFYRDYYLINDEADAFMENDIMLGIKYLIDVSVKLKKPIVICFGIGTNQGDHNGSGPLCEYLSTIANVFGTYICAPAGNEAGLSHHFRGDTLIAEEYQDVEILVGEGRAGRTNRGVVLELWADTNAYFDISIKPPIGEFSGVVSARTSEVRRFDFRLAGSRAEVYTELVEKSSGDQLFLIRLLTPAAGIWTVRVVQRSNNPGRFDMWLPIESFLWTPVIYVEADPDITVCEPGNVQNIITFAASTVDGSRIYVNSGRGYTRNGRIKPDLTAPGENVYAITGSLRDENVYEYRTGTSMAAAVGGGILAMFAEWSIPETPTNSTSAKQYLIRGADVSNISVPSRTWGWGRVNIYNTFVNISE